MADTHQLDIFGGAKAHDLVIKERQEHEYRERLRSDPSFARRSLILGCLNRRGPLPAYVICELLGMAAIDVGVHLSDLRKKGLIDQSGTAESPDGRHVWVWRALAKREE